MPKTSSDPATTQHTPGPWRFHKCRCGHRSCNKYRIGHAGAEGMFEIEDARLIVAAPALLRLVKEMIALGADADYALHQMTPEEQATARPIVEELCRAH